MALSDIGVGGEGLFKIAKYGISGRREAYRSYCGGRGLLGLVGGREEADGGEREWTISAWRRGIKPGNMLVPPLTKMEEASVFRRSTGT